MRARETEGERQKQRSRMKSHPFSRKENPDMQQGAMFACAVCVPCRSSRTHSFVCEALKTRCCNCCRCAPLSPSLSLGAEDALLQLLQVRNSHGQGALFEAAYRGNTGCLQVLGIAYVSIRQHTSAYLSIPQHCFRTPPSSGNRAVIYAYIYTYIYIYTHTHICIYIYSLKRASIEPQ